MADPPAAPQIATAKSRSAIRKIQSQGLLLKKVTKVHSRNRWRTRKVALQKGRHSNTGSRVGSRNARMPEQLLWMRRQRVLRNLLRKYRAAKKSALARGRGGGGGPMRRMGGQLHPAPWGRLGGREDGETAPAPRGHVPLGCAAAKSGVGGVPSAGWAEGC